MMFTALLPLVERAPLMLLISRDADAGVRVSVTQRSPDSRPSLSVVVTGTTEDLDRELVAALLSHLVTPPAATASVAAQVGEQVAASAAAAEDADDDTAPAATKPPAPPPKAKATKAAKRAASPATRTPAKPHPAPAIATVPDKAPARQRRRTTSASTPEIATKDPRAELLADLRVAIAQHGPDVSREQFLEMFPTTGRRYERHFPGGWKAFRAAERGEAAAPAGNTPPPAPTAEPAIAPAVDDKTLDLFQPTPAAAIEAQHDDRSPEPAPAGANIFDWALVRGLYQQQAAADQTPPHAPTEDAGAAFVAGVIDGATPAPSPTDPDPTEPTMLDLYGPTP